MSYQSVLNDFAEQKYFSNSTYLVATNQGTILVRYPAKLENFIPRIYDIASLTKIFATGCMLADAMENYEFQINSPIAAFPKVLSRLELDHQKTKNITVKQLISHTSGLIPWLPFYAVESVDLWNLIFEQAQLDQQRRYSDVGFILLGMILEDVLGTTIDDWFFNNFIKLLNLTSTGYRHQLTQHKNEIFVPTSMGNPFEQQLTKKFVNDYGKIFKFKSSKVEFRNYRLQGECNDGNAFYFNQISSHAGLFSTPEELAMIVKHWLKDDSIYLKAFKKLITFNNNHAEHLFCSSDATLSWNKNLSLYGHHGFTGCSFSIDQDFSTFRIFLSNRQFFGLDSQGNYPAWKKILNALNE
jgi:CubicO group peptidase (beta-lactamase class C family)